MTGNLRIAVDAMSCDHGAQVAVNASLSFLERNKTSDIVLVGNQSELEVFLFQHPLYSSLKHRLEISPANSVVLMDDKPSVVLRRKQDSSMAEALKMARDGSVSAVVSGGNTGALMALGRSILGTFHGVDRPAITKLFPSQNGGTLVLDLGANVDSSAEQLMQFALMGQILAQVIKEKEQADVALLNVGDENIKGNELVRLADSLIREAPEINYIGFAEGGDIFRGKADVLVCDGFVGNIALKSAEGAANIILDGVKSFFERSWFTRLLAKLLAPHMASALKQLDPDTHNGAMFLGLNGVVVKSHGNAKVEAFVHAIELADREARSNLPEKINKALEFIAFD
ncbi:hypothetical protein A3762_13455 [Oleiphilus sp. HI0125]|uniref:phosphate acyltransferase PlsX n=1 Tax=Oleiphilus sp. HI0125 TaxID=1822266 RepID=UPI0007C33A04|nr:phosphate acyltransferase PlsX [Oleiphilus sp. HI0125]KZZ62364.1 hypothetical protein A3762_13455 [Oleiphilus sp. HI0125]